MKTKTTRIIAFAWAALALGAGAYAQRSGAKPPTPGDPDTPPLLLYYGVAFALAAVTIGVAMMPSKRGHHD